MDGKMGWLTGFEPATPWTTTRCSNQLSYSHHVKVRLGKMFLFLKLSIPREEKSCVPNTG